MDIKEVLEKKSNLKIYLKIKEYKSTYISVVKSKYCLKISLHKLFLTAPEDIKNEVINFCLKRDKKSYDIIKKYANKCFLNLDYSYKLNLKKLVTKGRYFDLKQIYENLNLIYFQGSLNLNITWFEKPRYRRYSHFTFGSYDKNLKLIRINKLIDNKNFPFYFINYIVYHEMLHAVCKEEINERGNKKIHTRMFKELERKFAYYDEAQEFEKRFLKKGKKYGGT
jgi:hypothetical protein